MELSVATWNLQRRVPDDVGIPLLVDQFQPDVLLLQEADGAALEASAACASYAHRVLRPDAGYQPGMAVLSRHPILETGVLDDPSRDEARPRLIWARLSVGRELIVAALHAAAPIGDPRSDNPWRRAMHLGAIAAFGANLASSNTPAVIGGDCNTVRYTISGYTDAAIAAGHARPTWRPLGGAPWMPAVARLDRILVTSDLDVLQTTTACGLSRSDHCPVIARLRIAATLSAT